MSTELRRTPVVAADFYLFQSGAISLTDGRPPLSVRSNAQTCSRGQKMQISVNSQVMYAQHSHTGIPDTASGIRKTIPLSGKGDMGKCREQRGGWLGRLCGLPAFRCRFEAVSDETRCAIETTAACGLAPRFSDFLSCVFYLLQTRLGNVSPVPCLIIH